MSEAWVIAVTSLCVTTIVTLFGMGIKALWSIAKTFRLLVTKPECEKAMGEQCKDISALKKGFNENRNAITQIALSLRQLHDVDIEYKN
jgi:hypothetical protein